MTFAGDVEWENGVRIHLIAGLGAVLATAAAADAQRPIPYDGVVLIDIAELMHGPADEADWDRGNEDAYDERHGVDPPIGADVVAGRGARLNGTLVGAGVGTVMSRAIEENRAGNRGGAGRPSADRKGYDAGRPVVTTASADDRDGGATTVTVRSGLLVTTTTAESR